MSFNLDKSDKEIVAKLMAGRTGQMKSYTAILLVSVGKENFEDDALISALKMINQEFKSCCIAVADSLQRYNIATEKNISPKDAHLESIERGDNWLKKYEKSFNQYLDIPFEVLRWDTLINDSEYKQKKDEYISIFNGCDALKNSMDNSIEEYTNRLNNRLEKAKLERVLEHSKNNCFSYLQEECVAISLLPKHINILKEDAPVTIVYPGKATEILSTNRDVYLKNQHAQHLAEHSDYLNWLAYRFNKVQVKKEAHTKQSEETNYISERSFYQKQLALTNKILEAKLKTFHEGMDEAFMYEFNSYLLEKLFGDEKKAKVTLTHEPKVMANLFYNQLLEVFMVLGKSLTNQSKANVIRILKRMNAEIVKRSESTEKTF